MAVVGRFDGRTLVPEFRQELDFATDAYGFQAFADADGPVAIAWLANWADVDKSVDLPRLVGNTKPGSRVNVTVFRRGASKDLNITVAEVQPEKNVAQKPAEERKGSAVAPLGLVVAELSDGQKRELRVRGGVRIESAAEPAARAGLREGDVILAIANTEVLGVRDFETIMARVDKSRPVSLLIRRGDVAQYVLVRPGR